MDEPRVRRPGEASFATVLVVFSAAAFWQSYLISGFKGASEPGVFPMLASAMMLLSALAILRSALTQARPFRREERSWLAVFLEIAPPRFLALLAMIAAYVWSMPMLGFVVGSGLFLFSAFWMLWRRGPLWSLLLSLAALACVYLLFREIFQVVLPRGSLLQGVL